MQKKPIKIISWNVNGIRAVLKKNFHDFLQDHAPDILCLQETKSDEASIPRLEIPYPYAYFHSARKKGYSGTACFTKEKPISVTQGFLPDLDIAEGRVQLLEFESFRLVNVYTPNAKAGLMRLDYRYNEWDPQFRLYIEHLDASKPVIICGDLNVAHKPIDLANPEANRQSAGFTDQERERLGELLNTGFVDTFRSRYPDEAQHYSWWSFRTRARERNVGWRIDYCLVSKRLASRVNDAFILNDVYGSDHAPVGITLTL